MTIFEDTNKSPTCTFERGMETDTPQGRTVNVVDRLGDGDEVYFVKNTKDFDPKLFADQVINLEKSSELNYNDETYSMKLKNVRSSMVYVISSKTGCYEMMSLRPMGIITVNKIIEHDNDQIRLQGMLDDDEIHPLLDEVSIPTSRCAVKLKEPEIFNKKDLKRMERDRCLKKENDVVSLPETYYVVSDTEENRKAKKKQSEIIILDSDTSLDRNIRKTRVKKKKKHISEQYLPELVAENLKTAEDYGSSEIQTVTSKSKKSKRKEAHSNVDKTTEAYLSSDIISNEEKKPKNKHSGSNAFLVSSSDEETYKQKKKKGKKHADEWTLGTDSNQTQTCTIVDASIKKKSREKRSNNSGERHQSPEKQTRSNLEDQLSEKMKKSDSSNDEEINNKDQKTSSFNEEPSKIRSLTSDWVTSDNIFENNLEGKQGNLEDVPPRSHKRKSHRVKVLEGYANLDTENVSLPEIYVSSDVEKKKKVKKKPPSETTSLDSDPRNHRDVRKRLFLEENLLLPECKDEFVDAENLKTVEISTEGHCIPELQTVRQKSRKLKRNDPNSKSYRPEIYCDLSDLLANGTPKKKGNCDLESVGTCNADETDNLENKKLVTEENNREFLPTSDKKKKKKGNKLEKGISDLNHNSENLAKTANLEESDNLSNTRATKEEDELSQTSSQKSKKSKRKKDDCMVDKESHMFEVSLPEIECLLSHLYGDETKKKKKKSERNHSENVNNDGDQNDSECSQSEFKVPKCNLEEDCSIDKTKKTKKKSENNASVATPTRKSKKSKRKKASCDDIASDIFEESLPDIEGVLSQLFSEEKKAKKKKKSEIKNSPNGSSFTLNCKEHDKEKKNNKEDKKNDLNKCDTAIMENCLNDSRTAKKRKLTKIDSADELSISKKQKRKNDLCQLDSDISKVLDSVCPDLSIDEVRVMSKKDLKIIVNGAMNEPIADTFFEQNDLLLKKTKNKKQIGLYSVN